MSKRVQVTLSDEEFEMVEELAEARSTSMSVVIGDLLTQDVRRAMRQETAARQIAARKFAKIEEERDARLSKLKSRG